MSNYRTPVLWTRLGHFTRQKKMIRPKADLASTLLEIGTRRLSVGVLGGVKMRKSQNRGYQKLTV